jgi:hypothetical protein
VTRLSSSANAVIIVEPIAVNRAVADDLAKLYEVISRGARRSRIVQRPASIHRALGLLTGGYAAMRAVQQTAR